MILSKTEIKTIIAIKISIELEVEEDVAPTTKIIIQGLIILNSVIIKMT